MRKFYYKFHSYAFRAEIIISLQAQIFKEKKKKERKYFLEKKGNGFFFNLKQVSLNSEEN